MQNALHFYIAGIIVAQIFLGARKWRRTMWMITCAAITAFWIFNGVELSAGILIVSGMLVFSGLISMLFAEIEQWVSRIWPSE
jgi:hypothetical protein